jgi:hypothetical protein
MIYNNSFARHGRAADPASTFENPLAQPITLGAAGWLAARPVGSRRGWGGNTAIWR